MNQAEMPSQKQILETMEMMWSDSIKHDLYKWVKFTFPWGEKDTPLERYEDPKQWQIDELNRMSEHIHKNMELIRKGDIPKIYRSATVSGRGIGKTAFLSWTSLWMLSCVLGSSTVVAANTDTQLTNFTFAEIHKWVTLSINSYWWDTTQDLIRTKPWFGDELKKQKKIDSKYYYILGRLWTAEEPVKFAGLHNQYGFQLIFDEASGIADSIWDVSDGFFTDISPYRFHFAYSNPRVNVGKFYSCFHGEERKFWHVKQIDSRNVEGADVEFLNQIIETAGMDSDKARIEVLGQFPLQGDFQFIGRSLVEDATKRELDRYDDWEPIVMGIDPARYGPDDTAIRFRQGRDARSIPATVVNGMNVMSVVDIAIELINKYNPEGIFVDVGGVGAGVHDALERLGYNVFGVDFGTKAEDDRFFDCRTECWSRLKDWIVMGQLPNSTKQDKELVNDICAPLYEYVGREGRLKLESKDKMKKRGLGSPDNADALALTFFKKLCRKDSPLSRRGKMSSKRRAEGVGSDIVFSGDSPTNPGGRRVRSSDPTF